jgi:phospholipase/lecithinase/hemolysin
MIKRSIGALALAAALAVPCVAHAGLTQLTNLFVFGDSLSDGGNSGLATGASPYNFVFPPPPYADGRYSNGPVAVEQLWNLFNPGDASFKPSLAGGTNYAIGGATTGAENYNAVSPNVPGSLQPAFAQKGAAWELQTFLAQGQVFDPATSLFVVWLFPNDLYYTQQTLGGLPGTVPGSPGGPDVISNGIANIATLIATLAGIGAQNILVPNMPNLALTPDGAGDPALAFITNLFNTNLAATLDGLDAFLDANLPSPVNLIRFDTAAAFADLTSNPGKYGLTNVTDRCVANLQNGLCDPNSWLFWDGVHPTTAVDRILAQQFFDAAVPEPGSFALALLALAAVGAAAGRRPVQA